MPVPAAHVLYSVQLDTASGANGLFDGIQSFDLDAGIKEMLIMADGKHRPEYVAVLNQNPTIEFSTVKIAAALALCGVNGLIIDSDPTNDGLEAWFQKTSEGGTRAAGSTHIKLTQNEGILIPVTLSADNDNPATISYRSVITYDGTNDPIVIATAQALEGAPAVAEAFVVGKVMINGTEINSVQSVSVDFGVTLDVRSSSGEIWPTHAFVKEVRPKITIRTLDVGALNSPVSFDGVAQGATDSLIYLRKVAEGGTRVADATAQHISISVDDGMIVAGKVSGKNSEPLGMDIVIHPIYDGTNETMVISTATAIA